MVIDPNAQTRPENRDRQLAGLGAAALIGAVRSARPEMVRSAMNADNLPVSTSGRPRKQA